MEIKVQRNRFEIEGIRHIVKEAWSLKEGASQGHLIGPLGSGLDKNDVLITLIDKEPIGFVLATDSSNKEETVMHLLGVLPGYQGKNTGFLLMQALWEEMRKMKRSKLTWTFDPLKTLSANLYFHKIGGESTQYTSEPLSSGEANEFFGEPVRFFKMVWEKRTGNPHREKEIKSAMDRIPIKRIKEEPTPELLIEVPADFEKKRKLIGKLAAAEFKRIDGLLDHYINKKGCKVVDLLFDQETNKCYYKLVMQ